MMALVPLIAYAAFAASIIMAMISVVVLKYALIIAYFFIRFLWWAFWEIATHIMIWRISRRFRTPGYRSSRSWRSSSRYSSSRRYSTARGESIFARISNRLNEPAFPTPEAKNMR